MTKVEMAKIEVKIDDLIKSHEELKVKLDILSECFHSEKTSVAVLKWTTGAIVAWVSILTGLMIKIFSGGILK